MSQSDRVSEYLATICEQIRWKKAHDVITEEIENHIIDQRDAFIAEGFDEETATEKAILEMGDPVFVGSELDRTHRPKVAWSIIILTGIALMLRLLIYLTAVHHPYMPDLFPKIVAISTFIGIFTMAIAYYIDFSIIGKYPKVIFAGLTLLTVFLWFVTPVIYGRHISVALVLLLYPTAIAGIVYRMRDKGYLGIMLSVLLLIVPATLGTLVPSFTVTGLNVLIILFLLTMAIVRGWFQVNKVRALLLVYLPTTTASFFLFWVYFVNNSYSLQRILSALNPSRDPSGTGYMYIAIRDVLQGAQFIGPGKLGSNLPIERYLPEAWGDALLTYLIYRFGWIVFVVAFVLFSIFLYRVFILCSKQKSILGTLVSTSILLTLGMQVVFFFIFNLGFPMFSLSILPIISYSRTATIVNMFLIGIMLSVFKSGYLVRDRVENSSQRKLKRFEFANGKIIINLNTSS